ncbi:MAG: hypothetical protein ACREFO_21270 [Acetobacteraceae bacterium]
MVRLFYATSWVATNACITCWLVEESHGTGAEAGRLLLICGGVGYVLYIVGGALGEGCARGSRLG